MYNINDAIYAANILGIKFDKFTPEELLTGLNIEKEHGLINPITNVRTMIPMTSSIIAALSIVVPISP